MIRIVYSFHPMLMFLGMMKTSHDLNSQRSVFLINFSIISFPSPENKVKTYDW